MAFKYLLLVSLALIGSATAQCPTSGCDLPDCLCPQLQAPLNLKPEEIPQIVFLTFDDAINIQNHPLYEELFFERVNPNGYPITASFFITHDYNDYQLVHDLARRGNDIALHSITHQTNTQYWKDLSEEGWEKEFLGQKKQIAHFAKIPEDKIQGMRAPFLQTGGDTMMRAIATNLSYDCSRPTRNYLDPGLWPHTLDFDTLFQDCQIEPCARDAYPGFWNVPMVDLIGDDGFPCAMLDTCQPQPNTTALTLNLLKRNFLRHYEGNRAPFGVFTHAAWLADTFPGHKDGYKAFLDYLETYTDVYIVSISKGLEWIKNPTKLDAIGDFTPWQTVIEENTCKPNYNCYYSPLDTPFNAERYMRSCQTCPRKFPWLDNPLGDV